MPQEGRKVPKSKPSLTRTEVTVIWSTENIKRLLKLINDNRDYRIRFFPRGMIKYKICDVARNLLIDLMKNESDYMGILEGRGQVVRDRNGRWVPTEAWNSMYNNPVVTKFHDLKKRYDAATENFKVKSKWTKLSDVPGHMRLNLQKACPWYFDFRELDQITDHGPAPSSTQDDHKAPAQVPATSHSSTPKPVTKKKAPQSHKEVTPVPEASSRKGKNKAPSREVIIIDDSSSENDSGHNDEYLHSEHEMENDIIEGTNAQASGSGTNGQTTVAVNDQDTTRRLSAGVKREREVTTPAPQPSEKTKKRIKRVSDLETNRSSSPEDVSPIRSGRKAGAGGSYASQAVAAGPSTHHLKETATSQIAEEKALATKENTEVNAEVEHIGQKKVKARAASWMRQLKISTSDNDPKDAYGTPKVFEYVNAFRKKYSSASDRSTKLMWLHLAQRSCMMTALQRLQKGEHMTINSLRDCAIGIVSSPSGTEDQYYNSMGKRVKAAGALFCRTNDCLVRCDRPIRIHITNDLSGLEFRGETIYIPDEEEITVQQMSMLEFGRFWYKRIRASEKASASTQ